MTICRTLLVSSLVLALAACGGGGSGATLIGTVSSGYGASTDTGDLGTQAYTKLSGYTAAGDTLVHLFEWKWTDVAQECAWLGQHGYKGVQISPPNEHLIDAASGYPWWQRYQSVSYKLDKSRSGTLDEFKSMINACKAAGVEIYADVILNHTTGVNYASGVGSAGSTFSAYTTPNYVQTDYHPPCDMDYTKKNSMRLCYLSGLRDLDTSSTKVRQTLANYLISLNALGVTGFRVDAAKHISSVDLDAVFAQVNQAATNAGRAVPYAFLEVQDDGIITGPTYYAVGQSSGGAVDITAFVSTGVGYDFNKGPITADTSSGEGSFPTGWGSTAFASEKAVSFIANHDTERNSGAPYYGDGVTYRLAYVFLMGNGYGYTSVMSSYAFNKSSQTNFGPPSDGAGNTTSIFDSNGTNTGCKTSQWIQSNNLSYGNWVCQHRDPWMTAMVQFRHDVAGAPLGTSTYQNQGKGFIAESRGALGFFMINTLSTPATATFKSGLPAGTYCDLISGGLANGGGSCAGTSVVVDASGNVTATNLAAQTPVAITVKTKL